MENEPPSGDAPTAHGDQVMVGDRYLILEEIGRGGMGTVYRVRDVKLNEVVALKIIDEGAEHDDLERFRREVRIARKVTHANVVRTFDIGAHEGRPFLTMEFVPGTSLDHRMHEAFSLTEVLRVGIAVADGLAAAHQLGVVHRDLKPGNILLADDGRVLLTDFGIARTTRDPKTHATGVILGSPDYMAPEQVNDRPVGPFTDMYALGAVFYELLSGMPPFTGRSPIETALARLHKDLVPLDEVVPGLDDNLTELVGRLLSRAPADRPAARTVAQRLRFLSRDPTASADVSLELPVELEGPHLLVTPFRYRGSPEHALLGDGLAEELVDVLSQTRGLRISLGGSTSSSGLSLAKETKADYIVSGSVQVHGVHLRLRLRLARPDGTQVWGDSFDATIEQLFELEERMAQRLAESLRVQVTAFGLAGAVPAEVVHRYLEAKRLLRGGPDQLRQAAFLLDQACEVNPPVTTVVALRALAHVMAGFFGATMDPDPEGRLRAEEALELANRIAGSEPETHLANAASARERCMMEEELEALLEVLEIAPTNTEAHLALARLQVRTVRTRIGIRRLDLVEELGGPPEVHLERMKIAAYSGDDRAAWQHLESARRELGGRATAVLMAHVRLALWTGKLDALDDLSLDESPLHRLLARLVAMVHGAEIIWEPILEQLKPWPAARVEFGLVFAEVAAARGELDLAMRPLLRVAEHLHDLHWLERNPLVEPLRSKQGFAALLGGIRAVVNATFTGNAGTRVTLA